MCYQALKVHFLREAEFSQPTYRVLFLWLQLAMHDPRWLTHALEQAERLISHARVKKDHVHYCLEPTA